MAPVTPPRRNRSHSPQLDPSPAEESSVLDRGRPVGRNKSIRSVLLPTLSELCIDASLPTGLKPQEASLVLPQREREKLAKQAVAQAQKFEVLPISAVSTLSKELRALDERCEYLRKTFRSLRSGRQKLHARLLSYLKSECLEFSRERLLKQEEALEELDRAIDDWATKLDLAENRRLRLRQKLLEHVAAAMMLVPGQASSSSQLTPPGSREGSPQNSPTKDRNEVESIKIYADTGVLNLFTEVEMAIGRMCEAAF